MARNERHVAAIYCNKAAGFEIVHGLLDKLMMMLDVPRIFNGDEKAQRGYYLREAEDPSFFPGRAAHIVLRQPVPSSRGLESTHDLMQALGGDQCVGTIGVLHPEVLHRFDLAFPCSAFEFNLEPFL